MIMSNCLENMRKELEKKVHDESKNKINKYRKR